MKACLICDIGRIACGQSEFDGGAAQLAAAVDAAEAERNNMQGTGKQCTTGVSERPEAMQVCSCQLKSQ